MRKQGITKRFPVFALIFGILKTASIMPCKEDRKKFPKILHLFVFSKVICDLYLSEISLQHQYLPCKYREDWGLDDPSGKDETEYQKTIAAIEQKMIVLKKFVKENFEH